MMPPLLQVSGLTFRYNDEYILKDIDFSLEQGECVGIMGTSGCGKTTFCYCISGIIPNVYKGTLSGDIRIKSKEIKNEKLFHIAQTIGIVFQDPDIQLFSDNIEEDVAFGPENLCLSWEEIDSRIKKSSDAVGISKYLSVAAKKLSGGQRQLAAIASVLTMNPEIIIFDEALCQLDEMGSNLVLDAICNLKRQGKAIIMVDHEIENLKNADRILRLDRGTWI